MTQPIKYKNTGLEWCPQIPEHWELKKLKYNTYIKARVGWHGLKSDEFFHEGNGSYCVTGTDFKSSCINWSTCYKVSTERYDEDPYIQLKENDLLITKDGTIGKIALVKNLENKATLNSGVFVVRPLNSDYSTIYLFWILYSKFMKSFIDFTSRGSTIIHLYQDTFCNLAIPLPPLTEQEKIADYLDQKTSLIDSIISKKEKQIELYKEERTAIINHAVTKGLNPHVEMKDSGIEWLGSIPKHWEVCSLKQQIIVKDGTHDTPEYLEQSKNTFPFVTSKDIVDSSICFDSVKYISKEDYLVINSRSDVQFNDVIMPMIGTVGGCAIVDTHIPFSIKNVALFKTSFGNLVPQYLSYVLDSFIIKTQFEICARGGVQRFVSLEILKNLKIFKVSKKEQQEIVTYLDNETNRIDTLVSKTSKQIELLKEYKEALINEIVTGQRIIN